MWGSQTLSKSRQQSGANVGLRAKFLDAYRRIEKTRRKLEVYMARAEQKREELMNKLIEAQKNGDELRAKVYASEIANLKRIIKSMLMIDVKLEQASLKIQSVLTIGDAAFALKPIANDLKNLMGVVKQLIPNIEEEFEELVNVIDDLAESEFGGEIFADVYLDTDAAKILEEAQAIAQQKLKESIGLANAEGYKA